MNIKRFAEVIRFATLHKLGSIVADDGVEGVEISAHGMAVGSAFDAQDVAGWIGTFNAVVGNHPLHAHAALMTVQMLALAYAPLRGQASDTDAAARLAYRLVGGEDEARELRSSAAQWVAGPAGIALWDGGWEAGEDGDERRVHVATWAEVFGRKNDDVAKAWTDEEVEGDE